jgi:hypothetical protein
VGDVSPEIFFAQRRSVVGAVVLLPDHEDGADGVEFADGDGGGARGKTPAGEQIFYMQMAHSTDPPCGQPGAIAIAVYASWSFTVR